MQGTDMYQVKIVLDEQAYEEVAWSHPMTWEDVLHYVRQAHGWHSGRRLVRLASRKVNEARWIVDRGNAVALTLADDSMDEVIIRQAVA